MTASRKMSQRLPSYPQGSLDQAALRAFRLLPSDKQSGIALKDFEELLWADGIRLGATTFLHHQAVFALIARDAQKKKYLPVLVDIPLAQVLPKIAQVTSLSMVAKAARALAYGIFRKSKLQSDQRDRNKSNDGGMGSA